jgi:hypothetical protein
MKYNKKQLSLACPIDVIGASACPMAAFSGFFESHNLLHQEILAVSYRRIVMAIKMACTVGAFCIVVLLIVALET